MADYFENTRISAEVLPDDALSFFWDHGIFYLEDKAVGSLVEELRHARLDLSGVGRLKAGLIKEDTRIAKIIEQFTPVAAFNLSDQPGWFHAWTIDECKNDRIQIYIWSRGTRLEFSHKSHIGPLKAVVTANGLVAVPYVFLSETRNLTDIGVHLSDGGIMIAHPRLAFQVISGFAIIYDCWSLKDTRNLNNIDSATDNSA